MVLLLALLLAFAEAALAAPAPAVEVPPIALDLVVRDARNRPVERLTAADLTVSEEGTPLQVTTLTRVRPATRTFAIFLDEFHVTPGPEAERARGALIDLITNDLGPDDAVVVLKPLESVLSVQVAAGGREAALEAIRAFAPRQYDYEPRTDFERRFIAGAPPQIAAARAQISSAALSALVTALGAADAGRKTLLLVSDGFARRGSGRLEAPVASFDSIARAANRVHVSIYPLNLTSPDAGADTAERERARAALLALASGTAGRLISGTPMELRDALADASDYYLATVAPGAAVGDSRMHNVSMAVRTRGVTLRFRPGYFSQSPADRARVEALSAPPVARPTPVPRRMSTLIRPWFGMSRSPNGETQVDFAWEPSPPPAGLRAMGSPPALLKMSVTTADGDSVFEGVVAASSGPGAVAGAAPARASFSSPPGRLLVQMVIEDASARLLDRDVRDLIVNRFVDSLVIGTPEVRRGRTARDRQRMAAEETPVAVSRQFSRAESLLVRVPVSGASGTPTLSARLVSQPGSVLRTFEPAPVASRPGYFEVQLPLAWLAIGNYALEFSATSGSERAGERVAFRVTP